ncbi:hypothetical protein BDR26DRAFT_849061 [Obelidium mucronatum]|nr:hypothetical protein BDR26DRAFT_849061 [Obelidium mucronatum]
MGSDDETGDDFIELEHAHDDSAASNSLTNDAPLKETSKETCPICLESLSSTQCCLVSCFHSFCLDCISTWARTSEHCPLCKCNISDALSSLGIVKLRSPSTSQTQTTSTSRPAQQQHTAAPTSRRVTNHIRWGVREDLSSMLESTSHRSIIYTNSLFVKHVASNIHTKFRPLPSPTEFRRQSMQNPSFRSKMVNWIRRDLRVILGLQDVEIVIEYVLAVLEKHPLQTEDAMQLLRPYLRDRTEHFVHELVSFLRSGLTIDAYDAVAQYDSVMTSPDRSGGEMQPGNRHYSSNDGHNESGSSTSTGVSISATHSPRSDDGLRNTRYRQPDSLPLDPPLLKSNDPNLAGRKRRIEIVEIPVPPPKELRIAGCTSNSLDEPRKMSFRIVGRANKEADV